MAYDAKEKQVEYGMIEKNNRGEYIKVSRVIPEDAKKQESLDIRTMYTNSNEEIMPTQKGVRFNSDSIVEVVTAIMKALSEEERDEVLSNIEEGAEI